MMNRSADEIFNDALDKTGEERQQFLAEACAGNAKLRRDVDSLLQAYEAGDATLLPVLPPAVPARIGAYTIEGEIARGGVGVVYLARDDRLHRRVALKVLPARLAREPDWLEQFQREGQVLAALLFLVHVEKMAQDHFRLGPPRSRQPGLHHCPR